MDAIVNQRGSIAIVDTVDISSDADRSGGVHLQGRPIQGLIIPATNDSPEITFEVSIDDGSTWVPLVLADGSTAAISVTGGASAFAVESDLLTGLAGYVGRVSLDVDVLVRAAFSVDQTADRDLTWLVVG